MNLEIEQSVFTRRDNGKVERKMKYFQIVQKKFDHLGISSIRSRCDGKSAKVFFILSLAIILGILFLFFEANTFLEYTINIYITTVVLACGISNTVVLFKKEKIFESIDNFEKFFDESEYNRIQASKTMFDQKKLNKYAF